MNQSATAIRIEGHAIVSADGMIADRDGTMPEALHNPADWRLFQAALDRAGLVVLGRLGHERHPNPERRRLVVTSRARDLAPDPADANATFWNPGTVTFGAALARLGIAGGTVAVVGGTRVFDLFAPRFDTFRLAIAGRAGIPGGRPCFSAGPPDQVLAAAGLVADAPQVLDEAAGVELVVWRRPQASSASG